MNIQYKGYDYDDLLLIPRESRINSRTEVDLSVKLKTLNLDIPIIVSPMKDITSLKMLIEISKLGGLGILHRFYDNYHAWLSSLLYINKLDKFGVAVGLGEEDRAKLALDQGASIILVDIANGYIEELLDFCNKLAYYISTRFFNTLLMAGSVVTTEGALNLKNVGVNLIRVGIGSGALCSTREVTGVGIPQLTAIDLCSTVKDENTFIVADGGINSSGRAAKALAAGADLLMIGSLFANAYESDHNGVIYGMASEKLQKDYYGITKSIEGKEKKITKDKSLKEIIDTFIWGIKSTCTYTNARNIKELQENATFTEIIKWL